MTRMLAGLVLCVAGAARGDSPQAAFARVDRARASGDEAQARVATLMRALADAGMPRSATALLAALAQDEGQSDGVRAAAKAELAARAEGDPGLAELLLAQAGDPGRLPADLALRLARGHLERALQMAPLQEGAAFAGAAGDAQPDPRTGPAARELDRARALLASIPAGDPAEAGAHEVAGLTALAAGDDQAAEKEFVALAGLQVRRGDADGAERRDRAYLQLARLAYQGGDDAAAAAIYQRVGRGAPEWLDALFEASWAHFRKAEDEKALGNLLTLQAPFFQGRFFPESFVLKAIVLYQNCRYQDARAALADFERRYRPLHDGLADALEKLPAPQAASDFLARGAAGLEALQAAAREEVARLEQAPDVQAAAQAAAGLAQEIDSIDRRPPPFRESALIARVAPLARRARIALLDAAGRKLISRLAQERAGLRELLGQSLRLSFEIAGREKELAQDPAAGLTPIRPDPPRVDDDEELWPFQGEYWRDELGSYRVQLGRRCSKPRAPPQTASSPREPAAAPQAAAAGKP